MSLVQEILQGKHDSDLDTISQAVRERRKLTQKANATMTMFSIKVGDRVRLKNISPKYMIGVECTVTDKKRTKLVVKLDNPTGRFGKFGGGITVPASCVEKV